MATVFTIGGNTVSYGGFLLRELGKGSLTISKTVTGTGFDPAKTFELTVTFDKAVTYNGTTSTTHTFNLASGQSVTIADIPENTHYDVVETPLSQADIEAGYSIGPMTGGSGTIPNESGASASATNLYEGAMLPAKTIRFRFSDLSYDPSVSFVPYGDESFEWTRVTANPNVWDCRVIHTSVASDANLSGVFAAGDEPDTNPVHFDSYGLIVVEPGEYDWDPTKTITVVDANLSGVTSLNGAFEKCAQLITVEKFRGTQDVEDWNTTFDTCGSLSSVASFDVSGATALSLTFRGTAIENAPALNTSHITDFSGMFVNCESLREVPLYDTSSATDVRWMFYRCYNVTSGALALYTQMANQATPPSLHSECFTDCGRDTQTGAAELAQIPSDWK